MSNTQFAFLKRSNVPDRDALQSSIDALGFNLKLDPDFTPFEDDGFSPCILDGVPDVGFEIFYEPSSDITEDDEDLQDIAGDNDFCISMVWRSSFKDGACAMIVSCALAKDFGAVISYEGENTEDLDSLIKNAKSMLKEAGNET